MTSAGGPSSAGEAGRVDEGGQSAQAGEGGALASSAGESGAAGLSDRGGSSGGSTGGAGGGVAGKGGTAGSSGGSAGTGGSSAGLGGGGAGSLATLPCAVRAVLKARCQSCHGDPPSNLAPMSLLTWSAVSMYADAIQEKLDGDLMPPPGAPDLSPDQQDTLLVYVSLGAPPADNVTCP